MSLIDARESAPQTDEALDQRITDLCQRAGSYLLQAQAGEGDAAIAQADAAEAFGELYTLSLERVTAAVGSRTRNDSDVPDFVQQTYEQAYTSITSFRGERPESGPAWLCTIGHNVVTAAQTRRSTILWNEALADQTDPDTLPTADSPSLGPEVLEDLTAAIELLTENQRQAFLLAEQGLKARQIAKYMGDMASNTASALVSRARATLREEITLRQILRKQSVVLGKNLSPADLPWTLRALKIAIPKGTNRTRNNLRQLILETHPVPKNVYFNR